MKRFFLLICLTLTITSCSNDNDNSDVSSDRIIGSWKMISQKVNGLEVVDDCRRQTTFTFEASRVLRQVFFKTENNTCNEGSELISSWFNLGNSRYRINGSDGSSLAIDFVFDESETSFTTTETDASNIKTVTIFQKQ